MFYRPLNQQKVSYGEPLAFRSTQQPTTPGSECGNELSRNVCPNPMALQIRPKPRQGSHMPKRQSCKKGSQQLFTAWHPVWQFFFPVKLPYLAVFVRMAMVFRSFGDTESQGHPHINEQGFMNPGSTTHWTPKT